MSQTPGSDTCGFRSRVNVFALCINAQSNIEINMNVSSLPHLTPNSTGGTSQILPTVTINKILVNVYFSCKAFTPLTQHVFYAYYS